MKVGIEGNGGREEGSEGEMGTGEWKAELMGKKGTEGKRHNR